MQACGPQAAVGYSSTGVSLAAELNARGRRVATESFSRQRRLLNAEEFKQVFDGVDVRSSSKHLLLLARYNGLPHHRLGLVIAKKHVRQAVQRNRLKRVVREFFRSHPSTAKNLDVVVLARAGADRLDNTELFTLLQQQWCKLTAS